jgi:O-antigen ligase
LPKGTIFVGIIQTANMGRKIKKSVDTTSPLFFAFLILLVNVIPLVHLKNIPDQVLMPRLLLVNVVILGFYLLIFILKKQSVLKPEILNNRIILSLAALSLLTIISLFWAINPREGFFDVVKTLLFTMLVFTAVQVLIQTKNRNNIISGLVIITSLIASAVGYYQYVRYVLPDPNREMENMASALYLVTGIMGHKNQLSIALMLYLPFLIFAMLRLKSHWKVLAVIALISNLLLIFILETRSVWVGIFIGAFVTMIVTIFHRKYFNISKNLSKLMAGLLIGGIITAGGLIFYASTSDGTIHKKLETFTNPENMRNVHRLNTWKMSLNMSMDNPVFGVGAGNWKIVAPKYQKDAGIVLENFNWIRPHNDFLWMLTEKGIPGLLLFITIFFLAFQQAFKILRTEKKSDNKLFILLIVGALTGYLVVSLFSFPLERIHHQVFLALFLSIIIASDYQNSKKVNPGKNTNKLIILFIIISAVSIIYTLEMIRMERHLYKADMALKAENWDVVIDEAKSARSILRNIDHDNIPVNWYLGLAYLKTKNYEQAAIRYKKAVKASPYNPIVLNNYGQLLVESGKYKKARGVLLNVLELYPYYPEAIVNLSTCYYHLEHYRLAFKTLKRLKFRDRTPEIKNNLKVLRKLRDEEMKQKGMNQVNAKNGKKQNNGEKNK